MNKNLIKDEGQNLKKEYIAWLIAGIVFSCFFIIFIVELFLAIKNDEYFIYNDATRTKLLVFFVLSLMGFVSLGVGIKKFIDYTTRKYILKKGKETTATYISSKLVGQTPGFERYKITYSYVDNKGKKRTQTSIFVYDQEQNMYYKNLGLFKIAFYKHKSVIVQLYDNQDHEAHVVAHGGHICYYCGSVVGPNEKRCPNCGAKKFKN